MASHWHYLFADKAGETVCIKLAESCEGKTIDYLIDEGYTLRATTDYFYSRQIDDGLNNIRCVLITEPEKIYIDAD